MIIIISVYCIFFLFSVIFISYQKQFLKTIPKKKYHLFFLFPISLMLADALRTLRPKLHTNRKEKLKALYVFEDCEVKSSLFLAQIIAYSIGILVIFNTFALLIQITGSFEADPKIENTVNRPSYGERSYKEDYQVVIENEELYLKEELQYEVAPRTYTKESFSQALEQAKTYIKQKVLGENTSANNITLPLKLMESIPSLGMKINWVRDEEGIVKYDGSINNKTLTQRKEVLLTAVISSGEFEEEYDIALIIMPNQPDSREEILQKVTKAVQESDSMSSSKDQFSLPETIDGTKVYFFKEHQEQYSTVLFFGLLMAILVPVFAERKLKEQLEQRDNELRMDYPEVVNKLVLLIEAGMTVTRAWSKIVEDYETEVKNSKRKRRYAYEEMLASYYELKNGISEIHVFDNFGRRIKLTPYMKLSSLLAQNSTKGVEGVLSYIKGEAIEAFADRKELAKRLGEKAGTKMLLPMGIMLGIVLVVIIVPAFTIL